MTKIINLTPHAVVICDKDGQMIRTFESSGTIARAKAFTESIGELDGIALTRTTFGELYGLPEEQPGVYYIVSAMVANAATGRNDLLIPNESVRDEAGRIIGCLSLGKV